MWIFNEAWYLFSNQTVPAVEAPASDLLFHPANFLEVDENEDSQEQAEVEAEIMAENEEAAEKACTILHTSIGRYYL